MRPFNATGRAPATAAVVLLLTACGAALIIGNRSGSAATPVSPIRHVVFLIKENHSFDNLFARFPGADGTSTAREGNRLTPLGVTPYPVVPDILHSRDAIVAAVNHVRMNRFYLTRGAVQNGH